MKKILTFGRYLKKKYGTKVYKIPISISGFTCPNIDGTIAKGGCTFCLNDSFSPNISSQRKRFYLHPSKKNPYIDSNIKELQQQFFTTKKHLQQKYNAQKFIVYFQSFTNTYAPFDTLQKLYETALSFDDVVGLSIGTRTDCVSEEILEYLASLNKEKEIWIEYGIQSIYDETLQRINRGHNFANTKEWIEKTKKYNINICGHLIYGLPSETQEMMLKSTKVSYDLGIDSVKYHPLYVVKNTKLAKELEKGEFKPISVELYLQTLVKAIAMKPSHIIVQRVSAGFDDESLLAPQWCRKNQRQMKDIRSYLRQHGYIY